MVTQDKNIKDFKDFLLIFFLMVNQMIISIL